MSAPIPAASISPNEHIVEAVSREALGIVTGLFWDLGAPGTPGR